MNAGLVEIPNTKKQTFLQCFFSGRGLATYCPWIESKLSPVFVNNVLVEHSQTLQVMFWGMAVFIL